MYVLTQYLWYCRWCWGSKKLAMQRENTWRCQISQLVAAFWWFLFQLYIVRIIVSSCQSQSINLSSFCLLDKIVWKFMAYWPFGKQAQRFVWLDGIAVGSFCKEPPKILGGLFYSFQGLSFSSPHLQWAKFSFSNCEISDWIAT